MQLWSKCKHQILNVVVVCTARYKHALHIPSSSFVSYKLITYVEIAIALITLQEVADNLQAVYVGSVNRQCIKGNTSLAAALEQYYLGTDVVIGCCS